MNQRPRELLAQHAEQLTDELKAIDHETSEISEAAKTLAAQRETKLEDLRTIGSLRAMLDGTFIAYPRDVQSDEDILGLRIAGLTLSPQAEPSIQDLQLWQATMRTLCEHANHQIVLAADTIAEREWRERQGDVPTGGFPAIQPDSKWEQVYSLLGTLVIVECPQDEAAYVGRLVSFGSEGAELADANGDIFVRAPRDRIASIKPHDEGAAADLSATRPDAEAEQPQDATTLRTVLGKLKEL